MLIGIAFSTSDCGHKNLRWPWKNSLMFLWLFPFPCIAGLSCLSQGSVDVCRSRGQRLPKAGVCDLHIPAQVTQLPSLCISCLLDKTSCLFSHPACAVVQMGNVELSFPSCMGANVEFSFNVCPNFSNSSSCTDTAPACQVPAKNRLQLGVWSMLNIQGWSVF